MNKKHISAAILAGIALYFSWQTVVDVDEKAKSPAPVPEVKIEQPVVEEKPKQFKPSAEVPLSPELQRFAKAQADANGVPYILVLAVMEQESRFDVDADGGDSFGLMQIHHIHGDRDKIIEPHENIRIGCWLLGYLHKRYNDWNKALVAYNCGEYGAEEMYFKYGSISSPYSREVMFRSEKFAKMLNEPSVLMPR